MTDPNSQFGAAFGPNQMQNPYMIHQSRMSVQQYPSHQQFIPNMPTMQHSAFPYYYCQMGQQPYANQHPMPQAFMQQQVSQNAFPNYIPSVPSQMQYPSFMQSQLYNPAPAIPGAAPTTDTKRKKNLLVVIDPVTNELVDLGNASSVKSIVPDTDTVAASELSTPSTVIDSTVKDTILKQISSEERGDDSTATAVPAPIHEELPVEPEPPVSVNGFLESHQPADDKSISYEGDISAAEDSDEALITTTYSQRPQTYRYTQQEMLDLRKLPLCLKAPPNFPEIPNVTLLHDLDPEDLIGMDQQIEAMVRMMRGTDSYRGGLNKGGGQLNRRYMPSNITINLQRDVGFREAASMYKPLFKSGAVSSHTEELRREIRALLNKLTPENFNKIRDKILKLDIQNTEDLKLLCWLIFEKATNEKVYSRVFAKLCFELQNALSVVDELNPAQRVLFRQPLIKFCQERFETQFENYMKEQEAEIDANIEAEPDERTKALLNSNKQDQLKKREMQYYGNMKFIGELIIMTILKPSVFFVCTKHLLVESNSALDCLCELYNTVAVIIDENNAKVRNEMNNVFKFVEQQTKNETLESRIRFKLLDLIELRQRGWKKRDLQVKLQSGPMTLAEIQEESRKDEEEKSKAIRSTHRSFKEAQRLPSTQMSQTPRHSMPTNSRPQNFKPSEFVLSSNSTFDPNQPFAPPQGILSWAKGSMGGKPKLYEDKRTDAAGENWRTIPEDSKKGRQPTLRQEQRNRPASPLFISNRFTEYLGSPKANSTHSSGHSTPTLQQQMESSVSGSLSSYDAKIPTGRSSPTQSASEDSASVKDKNEQDLYSDDALRRKAEWAIPEYTQTGVLEEGYYAVPLRYQAFYIHQLIYFALEKGDTTRAKTGELIGQILENGIFSHEVVNEGINLMLNQCVEDDLEMDIPDFWKYMAIILEGLIVSEKSRLNCLENLNAQPESLVKMGTQLLNMASKRLGLHVVGDVFRASNLSWEKLLPDYNVSSFSEKENLVFTVKEVPSNSLKDRLKLIEDKDIEEVFDAIDAYVQNGTSLSSVDLSDLVEFVLSAALKSDKRIFQSRLLLLKKYATSDSDMPQKTEDIIVSSLERFRTENDLKIWEEVVAVLNDNRLISQKSLLKVSERTS